MINKYVIRILLLLHTSMQLFAGLHESMSYISSFYDDSLGPLPEIMFLLKQYSQEKQDKLISNFRVVLQSQDSSSFMSTSLKKLDDFVSVSKSPSPILMAVIANDIKAVDILISQPPLGLGFDPNVIDEYGMNALHLAAWLDLAEMAVFLLGKRVDPFHVTVEGFSSLHIAAVRGFDVVTNAILSHLYDKGRGVSCCRLLNIKTKRTYDAKRLIAYEMTRLPPAKQFTSDVLANFHRICGNNLSFDLPYVDSFTQNNSIDVVDHIDSTKFASDYYSLQRPLLIKGNLTREMGAWQHMHSQTSFLKRYGSMRIKTGDIPYPEAYGGGHFEIETIQDFVISNFKGGVSPANISGWHSKRAKIAFDGALFGLHSDIRAQDFNSPKLFTDLCGSDKKRPYDGMHQLSIGPVYSGAPLHSHVGAWNVCFMGVKHWLLFAPGHLRNMSGDLRGQEPESPYSSFPVFQGWGMGTKMTEEFAAIALKNHLAVEVLQYPGDLLFIPSSWGHTTLNLAETVSVAQEFGCLDDHLFNIEGTKNRLLVLPVMQVYSPVFSRRAGHHNP